MRRGGRRAKPQKARGGITRNRKAPARRKMAAGGSCGGPGQRACGGGMRKGGRTRPVPSRRGGSSAMRPARKRGGSANVSAVRPARKRGGSARPAISKGRGTRVASKLRRGGTTARTKKMAHGGMHNGGTNPCGHGMMVMADGSCMPEGGNGYQSGGPAGQSNTTGARACPLGTHVGADGTCQPIGT
jgi:hypothetical protein